MQCGITVSAVSTLVPSDLFKAELSPAREVPVGTEIPGGGTGARRGAMPNSTGTRRGAMPNSTGTRKGAMPNSTGTRRAIPNCTGATRGGHFLKPVQLLTGRMFVRRTYFGQFND